MTNNKNNKSNKNNKNIEAVPVWCGGPRYNTLQILLLIGVIFSVIGGTFITIAVISTSNDSLISSSLLWIGLIIIIIGFSIGLWVLLARIRKCPREE